MSEGKAGKRLKADEAEACRYCGRPLRAADPEARRFWPFCSDRCKMAELGMWFEDRYVVSRAIDEVSDDAAAMKALPRKVAPPADAPPKRAPRKASSKKTGPAE
jgi:endogenous inhibitor of DNA gyrase (YacG/DUF329 family)